jgi:hypothetical protein
MKRLGKSFECKGTKESAARYPCGDELSNNDQGRVRGIIEQNF